MLEFLKELRRRKVWFFGGLYLALGWLLLQVAIAVEETMNLPDWIDQSALILLALGFPVVLLLAWAQETNVADKDERLLEEARSVDKRPSCSVAVLPFVDLSRDGSFQDSADGISEDIITPLSFYDPLRVAARTSSFAFKGQTPDIRDVGSQLNVRYVLEGSIRKVRNNARITAQLIDAATGEHVWSKNFDCSIESLDDEIDDIVVEIITETANGVMPGELRRLTSANPDDLSVADLDTVAFFFLGDLTRSNIEAAEKYIQIALKKAPDDGYAHALMARAQAAMPLWGLGPRSERWRTAVAHLEKVKSAGTPDMPTLFSMAMTDYYMGKLNDLDTYAKRMRSLGPNHPGSFGLTALARLSAGNFEEYLETRVHGRWLWSVTSPFYLMFLLYDATAYLGVRDFARTEALAREYLSVRDHHDARELFVVALAHQGKLAEAASELDALKAIWPEELTLESAEQRFRLFFDSEDMIDIQLEGLRLAGLE